MLPLLALLPWWGWAGVGAGLVVATKKRNPIVRLESPGDKLTQSINDKYVRPNGEPPSFEGEDCE